MRNDNSTLIEALQDDKVYGHPVDRIELVETHISWILLTGPYAYKIKKPVNLGFLDFSTLELRHHYCEEELRLNRRLAPQLYLEVVAITGTRSRPSLNGWGPVIEYAVKMAQFDPDQQFDRLITCGALTTAHVDQLARRVAAFHSEAAVAAATTPYGGPEAITAPVKENFHQLRPLPGYIAEEEHLRQLEAWSEQYSHALAPLFVLRKAQGYVREGHGDLHLANITLIDGEPVVFDCLEFNERLRWIDTMSDVAFLVMDLDAHRRPDLAARLLNGYLEACGDYDGLRVLDYYRVYRALVRAKVTRLRLAQVAEAHHGDTPDLALSQQLVGYLRLAADYTRTQPRGLIITHGLSGSGKSTVAQLLVEHCGMIRVRSDVERKRLYGLAPEARSGAAIDRDIYQPAATEHTYSRLAELARTIDAAGYPVIVDATFLRRAQREAFRQLAAELRIPFLILSCHAPDAQLRQWIRERSAAGGDVSEADLVVLDRQIAAQEILGPEEQAKILSVDTTRELDPRRLAEEVLARLN